MASWFQVTITEARVLGGVFHRLCRDFQRAFIDAGAPAEMALFVRTILMSDERIVYFSPGSVGYVSDLIRAHGGHPAEAPDERHVTLLFGVPDADTMLATLSSDRSAHSTLPRATTR